MPQDNAIVKGQTCAIKAYVGFTYTHYKVEEKKDLVVMREMVVIPIMGEPVTAIFLGWTTKYTGRYISARRVGLPWDDDGYAGQLVDHKPVKLAVFTLCYRFWSSGTNKRYEGTLYVCEEDIVHGGNL